MTLLSAPIELKGDWKSSPPNDVSVVISRMRAACLDGIPLVSDHQPNGLIIDNHSEGPPAIWLHTEPRDKAWIIVDIADRDWSQLAYQFGHELGHVLCNSWEPLANPPLPSRWLEESLVEAFSVRGLGILARSWADDPPFPGDQAFGMSLQKYRDDLIAKYRLAGQPSGASLAAWHKVNRDALDKMGGLNELQGPLIAKLVDTFEQDHELIAGYGALNRWPARTGVPVEEYLRLWKQSCLEIRTTERLPSAIELMLYND